MARRDARRLQAMIAEIEHSIMALERSIEAEQELAGVADRRSLAYPASARAMEARLENLGITRAALVSRLSSLEPPPVRLATTAYSFTTERIPIALSELANRAAGRPAWRCQRSVPPVQPGRGHVVVFAGSAIAARPDIGPVKGTVAIDPLGNQRPPRRPIAHAIRLADHPYLLRERGASGRVGLIEQGSCRLAWQRPPSQAQQPTGLFSSI